MLLYPWPARTGGGRQPILSASHEEEATGLPAYETPLPTPLSSLCSAYLVQLGVPHPEGLVPEARGLVHRRGLVDPLVQDVQEIDQLLDGLTREADAVCSKRR